MKKRVGCLYRVSTLKQVEEEDIPMQKRACREFIENKDDWILEKEYYERGVSGFKLAEADRDVLQDLKKDVANKKIDVLLVFMFDRIGRKEDETPFVVEWLVKKGIEVWSVKEGQRTFDNRVDKLLNYLTYWQAGGESEKTSIRVNERQIQMAKEGTLTYGGKKAEPYGYTFIKSGTYTKKGVERYKLIINDEEAKVVKMVYNLLIYKGYGNIRIAKELNMKKIKTKKNKIWGASNVNNILKNPLYMGYPAYNKSSGKVGVNRKAQPFEDWVLPEKRITELAIISEETWYKAREIRKSRNKFNNNVNNKPKQTKSDLLFTGIIKCGECGRNLVTAQNTKTGKNGNKYKYLYYMCRTQKLAGECNLNKKRIRKEQIEDEVLKLIFDYLNTIESIDLTQNIKKLSISNVSDEEEEIKILTNNLKKVQDELIVLKNEVVKTLTGESIYSAELLKELINKKENEIQELIIKKDKIEQIVEKKNLEKSDLEKIQNMIPVWKQEFQNADTDVKKMLLSEIIKEIILYNDRIEIVLRLNIKYKKVNEKMNNKNIKFSYDEKVLENTMIISKEA